MDIRTFLTKRRPVKEQNDDPHEERQDDRSKNRANKTKSDKTRSKKRPKPIIESDSDEDFVVSSESKKTRAGKRTVEKNEEKLQPTTPNDFFASNNGKEDKGKELQSDERKERTQKRKVEETVKTRSNKYKELTNEASESKKAKSRTDKESCHKKLDLKKGSDEAEGPKIESNGKEKVEKVKMEVAFNAAALRSNKGTSKDKRCRETANLTKDESIVKSSKEGFKQPSKEPDKPPKPTHDSKNSAKDAFVTNRKNNGTEKVVSSKSVKKQKGEENIKCSGGQKVTGKVSKDDSMPSTSKLAGERGLSEQLWADKFRPKNLKQLIGQQGDKSCMNKLLTWLSNWDKRHLNVNNNKTKKASKPPPWNSGADDGSWAKAALLSGPPGVGKTSTAHLVGGQLGFDVVEMNASDTRSKKLMQTGLQDMLGSKSVQSKRQKMVLVMDEVDGMAGNEDRGGVAELINLIKKSKLPVICICNDRNHQKIRSLANHCFDLRFQRPRVEQIKAAMLSVCFKEKLKVNPQYLTDLIVSCNQDIRQVLQHLSVLSASTPGAGLNSQKEASSAKKSSIKIGPFDVVRQVLSSSDRSLNEKAHLFFEDYSLGPLFVQENYLNAIPHAANGNRKQEMELVSQASLCMALGDTVSTVIRSRNAWNLLPTQAIFSSVLPGEYMSGHMKGQIMFPQWFGKFSKGNKMDRMLMELQAHMRMSSGASKRALNNDLLQPLRDGIITPLREQQSKGVDSAFKMMQDYNLMREDLDNLLDLCSWPGKVDPMKAVESKAKSAFTRLYNKKIVLPYATATSIVQKSKGKTVKASFDEKKDVEDDEDNIEENEFPTVVSDDF